MATPRRSRSPPPATILASPSSSSPNPAATTSSSPYFLPELIPKIASLLTSLQDFFALRAACSAYRALLPPSPSTLASQAPHLLIPEEASGSHALFDLALRRRLRFRIRLAAHDSARTGLYALGCRVAVYDRTYSTAQATLHIVHLLTGERVRLPDPPKRPFCRLLLSGDLVFALKSPGRVVQYCRLGDALWRVASCCRRYLLKDLIFVQGTLYALVLGPALAQPRYRLAIAEFSNADSVELAFLGDDLDAETVRDSSHFYLAECHGDLLLVGVSDVRDSCHVFRWQTGVEEWVKTASLGGCALFFSGSSFEGCLGPDHPWCGGTAYTSHPRRTMGGGSSFLWLMDLMMNSLLSTLVESRNRFGSFQACADQLL